MLLSRCYLIRSYSDHTYMIEKNTKKKPQSFWATNENTVSKSVLHVKLEILKIKLIWLNRLEKRPGNSKYLRFTAN